MWGFADVDSWIPEYAPSDYRDYGAPLIYDKNYEPKDAYTSLIETLKRNQIQQNNL